MLNSFIEVKIENVSLTPELEEMVSRKVESRLYNSAVNLSVKSERNETKAKRAAYQINSGKELAEEIIYHKMENFQKEKCKTDKNVVITPLAGLNLDNIFEFFTDHNITF